MVFIFIFLPVTCLVYYLCPSRTVRNVILTLASLFFYAWGEPAYIILMIGSILANWAFALIIAKLRAWGSEGRKEVNTPFISLRIVLTCAVVFNIGLLFVFKYLDFFLGAANWLLRTDLPLSGLVLPIGISFYTFQALSYVIDVYRGDSDALKSPLKVALFISLFPQLIAGPIVRYGDVKTELTGRRETASDFFGGLERFMFGLGAKVILANNLAVVADGVFSSSGDAGAAAVFIAAVAYMLQIFFDFSGYSTMATGLGRMFGFHFPRNFNAPYMATSITDFWRRWHMTLSVWFRDYVYIPLGGNRCSTWKHIRNIMLTWLLTGFWHGAGWNFMLWGVYYGLLLLIEKYAILPALEKLPERASRLIGRIYTLILVLFGWLIFRTDDASVLAVIMNAGNGLPLRGFILAHADMMSKSLFIIPAILFSTCFPSWLNERLSSRDSLRIVRSVLACIVFIISVFMLEASTYNPFIYFRF